MIKTQLFEAIHHNRKEKSAQKTNATLLFNVDFFLIGVLRIGTNLFCF